MELVTLLLTIVAIVNAALGLILLFNAGERSRVSLVYAINVAAILSWTGTMLYFRIGLQEDVVWLAKLLYISATLIASSFLYFSYVFPKEEYCSKLKTLLIFGPNLLLAAFTAWGPFIISDVIVNPLAENTIIFGEGYIAYVAYILVYFLYSFYRLFVKYLETKSPIEKRQIIYLLIGYVIPANIAFATNLILPWMGIYDLNWAGQVSTVLMVMFATYSILRHQLFNSHVVATEILVFVMEIFILIRTLLADSFREQVLNGMLFVITSVLSVLLIKSVFKEVESREEIAELAKSLKTTNVKLQALDKKKSEFISIATHQIRSPLAALKGYASLILEGSFGEVPKKLQEPIQRIYQSSNSLVYIVNDFLDISRIELDRLKFDFVDVDVKEVVEQVIEEQRPAIEGKGLVLNCPTCEVGEKYMAHADVGKLRQVVGNFIDNAVKYTPKGSIQVTMKREVGKIIIMVKDTGIGMSKETISSLFEKFSRAKNASKTNVMGTGLGLFVARKLITAHKGRVWAESEGEGKGSTFYIEIPAKK